MSILGDIFGKIFHRAQAKPAPQTPQSPAGGSTNTTASAPQPTGAGATPQARPQQAPAGATATATAERVDVEPILDGLLAQKGQQLNWRTSIVDLMKLLDLDSSLQARKALADELHYTGDRNDSAAMNIWLHKQVMRKLEENGGKVPADLKD